MTPAQEKIREWRHSPTQFVRECFGVEPDVWQVRALTAFGRQDKAKLRIALRACVGPGKTAVLAWCGWNFLLCYGERGHHPKGAAVSITGKNLQSNLWPELAKWHGICPILQRAFKWTKTKIVAIDHPSTWFLDARSFEKRANPDELGRTLSGIHSKYVLILVDESGDIPPPVLKAGEQALAERDCAFGRILQAGNPSSQTGMLYQAAVKQAHLWENIRVTGDPDDPERSPRIDIEWAREQISLNGKDNPWVMYAILGEFPPTALNALLGVDQVEAAMSRHYTQEVYHFSQKRLGVDVALQGDDRTVLFPRQGLVAFKPVVMRTQNPEDIAARVAAAKTRWESELEFVDGTGGYGSGVISHLRLAGFPPIEVQFSGKAIENTRYYNKRCEMWWLMAEWVKHGGALPKIPELVAELTEPTYTLKNGKFLIEPKELLKKRLGRSPDLADALGLTFALPEAPPRDRELAHMPVHRPQDDYDPFSEDRL